MHFSLEFMKAFTDNLGKLFGNKCEIIIHDFTSGYDSTIVHIVNGEVSGRSVGGCPTNLFFEHLADFGSKADEFSQYFSTMPDGRLIKSSTSFLKGENGEILGSICVNVDVSDLASIIPQLTSFLTRGHAQNVSVGNEHFAKDVNDLMEGYLVQVEADIGMPANKMKKQEKLRALSFLESKGVLQIAKANVKLCEFFNISKFTLYNYLNEIHSNQGEDSETNNDM